MAGRRVERLIDNARAAVFKLREDTPSRIRQQRASNDRRGNFVQPDVLRTLDSHGKLTDKQMRSICITVVKARRNGRSHAIRCGASAMRIKHNMDKH